MKNLFGEIERSIALSQWHTPQWIARRLASWVPSTAHVLEAGCGGGSLIAALLERGHDPTMVQGVELDEQWAEACRKRFDNRVQVTCQDFLTYEHRHGCCLMNPPFEENLHARFISRGLELAEIVIALCPVAIEFGQERDRTLWAHQGQVIRRARLPERVRYGGAFAAKFETIALLIGRRTSSRTPREVAMVVEEVWRDDEPR